MRLHLHRTYLFTEVLTSLRRVLYSRQCSHGQFLVRPKSVVCLVTTGVPEQAPHFASPSLLLWQLTPGRNLALSRTPASEPQYYQLLVRPGPEEPYLYAGRAHLEGSFEIGRTAQASFQLRRKLPRADWLRFDGYPDWLLDVNGRVQRVARGAQATFDGLLAALDRQSYSYLTLTRYEEDQLVLHTNRRRAWLHYRPATQHGSLCALAPRPAPAAPDEEFYHYCGFFLKVPAARTLERAVALDAVRSFFMREHLPAGLLLEPG